MDFIQNLRVGQLLERFQYFSEPANTAKFDSDHIQKKFMVERWADGYVHFTGNTLKYKDLATGKTFILRNNWQETDYPCYQALYQTGISLGTFRFMIPVFHELIQNGDYEYMEFSSPIEEHGDTFSTLFLAELMNDPKQVFREYVNQFAVILQAASSISSSNNVGLPFIGFLPDRMKDSSGYFWPEVLEWNFTKDTLVSEQLEFFAKYCEFPIKNKLMTEQDRAELVEYARQAWSV